MDKRILKNSETDEEYCLARITRAASFLAVTGIAVATVLSGGTIAIAELGVALATIAAGHGVAIKMKTPKK